MSLIALFPAKSAVNFKRMWRTNPIYYEADEEEGPPSTRAAEPPASAEPIERPVRECAPSNLSRTSSRPVSRVQSLAQRFSEQPGPARDPPTPLKAPDVHVNVDIEVAHESVESDETGAVCGYMDVAPQPSSSQNG